MRITTTTFFDEGRGCWRVRFRGPGVDTKLNVPPEEYNGTGVSSSSSKKPAENIATAWAARQQAEFTRTPAKQAMSLEEIYALMKARNPEGVSQATWDRNDIHFRNLKRLPTRTPLGSLRPDLIDREIASQYRDERRVEDAKGRTIQGELALLKQLLRFGFEDAAPKTGMTAVRFTKLPKIDLDDEESMVALSVDQFFAVLEATRQVMRQGADVTRRRLIFGVTTMLRKTPLMGLRSEWIDLEDAWLVVPKEYMKGKGGKKRALSVPLCGWAVEQLPHPMAKSGYIWPNTRTGEPTGNLTHTLQKLADAARVPEFSLHDLRATGSTWLANEGVPERIRQYLMGHADGGPVISRYTKITADTEKQIRDAVAVFDDIRSKHDKNVESFFKQKRRA